MNRSAGVPPALLLKPTAVLTFLSHTRRKAPTGVRPDNSRPRRENL